MKQAARAMLVELMKCNGIEIKLTNQANCVETNHRAGMCRNEWHRNLLCFFLFLIRNVLRFIKCEGGVLRKHSCSSYTLPLTIDSSLEWKLDLGLQ